MTVARRRMSASRRAAQPSGSGSDGYAEAHASATKDDSMKPIVRHLPFPSDDEEQTIEVFYQQGDPAFVCGAHGSLTGGMIADIEKDFADNPDEGFDRGDGIYLYVPRWVYPQVDGEGRIELPGYWDLELVGFKTMEQAMSNAAGQTPAVASRAEPDCSAWFCCSRCGVSGQWSGWVSAFDPAVHRCDTCYAEGKDHELLPVPNEKGQVSE